MNPKKIAIFLQTGDYDRLYTATNIAASAASMECEVYIILLFWALKKFVRGEWDEPEFSTKGSYQEEFKRYMERSNMPSLYDMLENGRRIGRIKMIACSASMQFMELKQEEIRGKVDEILGFPSIFRMVGDAGTKLFI